MKRKLFDFLQIFLIVTVVFTVVFGFTFLYAQAAYGGHMECVFIRCVKIIE